jgi:hypothetical protein
VRLKKFWRKAAEAEKLAAAEKATTREIVVEAESGVLKKAAVGAGVLGTAVALSSYGDNLMDLWASLWQGNDKAPEIGATQPKKPDAESGFGTANPR